jgi:hypothetical protein
VLREGLVWTRKALARFVVLGVVLGWGCSKSSSDGAAPKNALLADADAGDAAVSNDVPPSTDAADLDRRASALFQAVAKDDPALAEPFWFPKEPFLILKDPPDPGGYWDKLHGNYADDVHALHATRPSWEGATFDHFEIGSPPRWMNPGEEHNRIGYYRSFGSTIHFRAGDKMDSFVVDVIITWRGRWYVTHLRRVRK